MKLLLAMGTILIGLALLLPTGCQQERDTDRVREDSDVREELRDVGEEMREAGSAIGEELEQGAEELKEDGRALGENFKENAEEWGDSIERKTDEMVETDDNPTTGEEDLPPVSRDEQGAY